jgi:uncharacterized protein (TIGR03790 family)
MAKSWRRFWWGLFLVQGVALATAAPAQGPNDGAAAGAPPARAAQPLPARMAVPRLAGRLHADQLGLVINLNDPYSVEVGAHYQQRRGLHEAQVLRVRLPLRDSLSEGEADELRQAVAAHFGGQVQALALAWTQPWAVGCNSLNAVLAFGYDAALCRQSCARSMPSRYFNTATHRPWTELRKRPSMLLAAHSVAEAKAMIDRGVDSDGTLGRRGAPPVRALLLQTEDAARNVRAAIYPAPEQQRLYTSLGLLPVIGPVGLTQERGPVALLQVGLARLDTLAAPEFVPGALADHLTSMGGMLTRPHGQSTAMDWISLGATASHGAASEPCNHLQKFPQPQVLALHFAQGATALEAYWKSVAWPQQSVFVGEPLAAPFDRSVAPARPASAAAR